MIQVLYSGGLGNNLFQYALGRILAEELGYELKADPINGFPGTYEKVSGESYEEEIIYNGHYIDIKEILKNKPKKCIVLDGFFQQSKYYEPYKSRIKNWFRMEEGPSPMDKNDLLVHIRRGDYFIAKSFLPMEFYSTVVNKQQFHRIFVCTDNPRDQFVRKFIKENNNASILSKPTLEEFRIMVSANNICISQSTFSWWAAFLSNANKIYYPLPKNG